MDSVEALEFLVEQQSRQEPQRGEQTALSFCAAMILRNQGEFVFAEVGAWQAQGEGCVTHSGNTLLTQATKPVRSGNASIYLRDQAVHPRAPIELVQAEERNLKEPNRTGDLVLASFSNSQLHIPGLLKPTRRHQEATQELVDLIGQEIDPLGLSLRSLPKVLFGDALQRGLMSVTNLRKHPGPLFRELDSAELTRA